MMKNKAFTLAETLITLMIIGVIAAITVPALNQNIKRQEYAAGCLKAYSSLSQAVNRMKTEFGPVGLGKKWNDPDEFWEAFSKQMNTLKVCNKGQAHSCIPITDAKRLNNDKVLTLADYALITVDGMSYNFATRKSSGYNHADFGVDETDANIIGRFVVDVNGSRAPNQYGRDQFFFVLVKGSRGIVPAGADINKSCYMNKSGVTCAALVIRDKKMDYPKN